MNRIFRSIPELYLTLPLLVIAIFLLLATWLPLVQQEFKTVSGPVGAGVTITASQNNALVQKISVPDEHFDSLFIRLDGDYSEINAELRVEQVVPGIKLSSSQSIQLSLEDEKYYSGAAFSLSEDIERRDYFLVLTTSGGEVQVIADEREESSADSAKIISADGKITRQGGKIAVGFLDKQTRWQSLAESQKQQMIIYTEQIVAIAIVAIFIFWLAQKQFTQIPLRGYLIGALLIVISGISLRIWLAHVLPVVNDEQFYTYDALLYEVGYAQFWKTPLLITFLRGWIEMVGISSLATLRLLLILVDTAAISLLAFTTTRLTKPAVGLAVLAVGMLLPTVLPFTMLVMTEHMMLLPVISAVSYVIYLRQRDKKISFCDLLIVSLLIGLAVTARWSAIFWFIAVGILLRHQSKKEYLRRVVLLAVPYFAAIVGALILLPDVVNGFRLGGFILEFFETSSKVGWLNKWTSWRVPLAVVAPLWLLALLAWPTKNYRRQTFYIGLLVVAAITFLPVLLSGDGLPQYLPAAHYIVIFPILIGLLSLLLNGQHKLAVLLDGVALLIPPFVAYIIFPKINPKYITELMPALIFFGGLGVYNLWFALRGKNKINRAAAVLTLFLLITWFLPWNKHIIDRPYAGTLAYDTVADVVGYIARESDPDDKILTASNIIPLLAQREPAVALSHPAWINPTWRGIIDTRFNEIHDPIAELLKRNQIDWVIDEKLTTDTYRRHPGIDRAIREKFELVKSFDNDGARPIEVLRPIVR